MIWELDTYNFPPSSTVENTRRYGPLRRPASCFCGELWPLAEAFFDLQAKKRLIMPILVIFWCSVVTFVSFSSNFEKIQKKVVLNHSAVYSGGVSKRGCMTGDTRHVTCDIYFFLGREWFKKISFVSVLLSAQVKRYSIFRMRDFFTYGNIKIFRKIPLLPVFLLLPGLTKRYIKCVFPRIITYLKIKKERKFAKLF